MATREQLLVVRPLELTDRALVTGYLRRYPPQISELTFTNLFVWRKARPASFAEVDGSLVFILEVEEDGHSRKTMIGPPVGEAPVLDVIESLGVGIEGIARLPTGPATVLRDQGIRIGEDRDNWDYVYRMEDLAELTGRRFHKKRNLVKQCLQAHECRHEAITEQNLAECIDMQERWCMARQCGIEPGLCKEYLAIQEMFAHYGKLHLIGGAVRVDGSIEAYAIGEELSPGTAVCHFEKAMPGTQGLGQVVNQWFVRHFLSRFVFVNREQDMGIPGLRQAKESYYPHHMVEKFTAFLMQGITSLPLAMEPRECHKHAETWD
jgi:hypothetical protein